MSNDPYPSKLEEGNSERKSKHSKFENNYCNIALIIL